jgi:acetoin utilization protein AcuC
MYMKAYRAVVLPLIRAYNPDVIVFELGADALAGDPLAHLCLTNNTYAGIIESLLRLDKPILATGGGGYNVENTARAWALAWSVLTGEDSQQNMNVGMGGVMLESTDWQGGLRDREFVVRRQQREMVLPAIEAAIEAVKANVFPLHGL